MTGSLKEFKGRYLAAYWLIFWLVGPAALLIKLFDIPTAWYWWDSWTYLPDQLLLGLILLFVGVSVRLNVRSFFGSIPDKNQLGELGVLFVFLWALSGALDYIIFYPLSFLVPDLVSWWYFNPSPVVYTHGTAFPLIPNALSLISLVILAPVFEEVLFRGYLLHRWAHKWGMPRAIALSSFIFGIAHPDIVPATVFGVAMCVVYLRSGSLIGPILFHAAWNLLYWFWQYYDLKTKGVDYRYTLEDFQAEWQWGIVWILLSIFFIYVYSRQSNTGRIWRLPVV